MHRGIEIGIARLGEPEQARERDHDDRGNGND
jgi:hypothetical protein